MRNLTRRRFIKQSAAVGAAAFAAAGVVPAVHVRGADGPTAAGARHCGGASSGRARAGT